MQYIRTADTENVDALKVMSTARTKSIKLYTQASTVTRRLRMS